MVIVQGSFRFDPAQRDAYLAQSVETMLRSRAERGCLEYTLAADPAEPDRVILSERWESMDDLNEHVRALNERRRAAAEAAPADSAPGVAPLGRDIAIYHVASVEPMG